MSQKEVTRLRDLKTSARDQLMIDPRIIVIEEGHNPRDYSDPANRQHLDRLKSSIRESGTLNPLWVRYEQATKQAILVDGECRLRANLELIAEGVEIVAVPCIQVSGNNEAERLILALTANTGKQFSALELGSAFQRLVRMEWTEEMIAKRSGHSARTVSEAIELADAPQAVKEMVEAREVTPALAISAVRRDGCFAPDSLREKVAQAGGKTARRAKTLPVTPLEIAALSVLEAWSEEEAKNGWVTVQADALASLRAALPVREVSVG